MGILKQLRHNKDNHGTDPVPSPQHKSVLYPELQELMMRNERWAKRTATADPG